MCINLLSQVSVFSDPNKKVAQKGQVLVGLGNTNIHNEGIVLQHKTAEKRYASLSAYILETSFDEEVLPQCCQEIYLEDFSVDTVISLYIFFTKISCSKLPENLSIWVDYASRWEQGDTSSTGKPFESYGCLQNALVQGLPDASPKERLGRSFVLLETLIENKVTPSSIPDLATEEYKVATSTLQNIDAVYHDMVEKSEVVTLCVDSTIKDECTVVSGIFIDEPIVSSIIKVFLRNDEKSPTGDGYGVMAVYNADAKGTGNDIVISVDPSKEVHLKKLWEALEKEENELWKNKRPKDLPRKLVSYPDNNGPNEPWWDDMGKYTLIAAPKMVDKIYGRQVSWERVKELIKELYYFKGERR